MLDDDSIDKFDNSFFYTTSLEAEAMDPQQRLLFEIAYETIENAGIPLEKVRGSNTAVFAGETHFNTVHGNITENVSGMEGSDYHTIAWGPLLEIPLNFLQSMLRMHHLVTKSHR